jgi:hypothetical protein
MDITTDVDRIAEYMNINMHQRYGTDPTEVFYTVYADKLRKYQSYYLIDARSISPGETYIDLCRMIRHGYITVRIRCWRRLQHYGGRL